MRSSRRVADAIAKSAAQVAHFDRTAGHGHDACRQGILLVSWSFWVGWDSACAGRHGGNVRSPAVAPASAERAVGVSVAEYLLHGGLANVRVGSRLRVAVRRTEELREMLVLRVRGEWRCKMQKMCGYGMTKRRI